MPPHPPQTRPTTPAAPPAAEVIEPTISEKFIAKVQRQFQSEMGSPLAWTPLQRTLGQHLYLKIDASLRDLEIKRQKNNAKRDDPPITWANVNMTKLALDSVHRINLELDALIPNHIHVIPYLNGRTKQYDVDLRIGYMGVDHCHRRFSIDPPLDIRYQLVHDTDKFSYGENGGIAYVNFEQTNPFSPGTVIGGFGYITFEDPRKNRVIIVEYREFEKARRSSYGTEFWGGPETKWVKEDGRNVKVETGEYDERFEKEMQYKTVVLRVANKLPLDPNKVNVAAWDTITAAEIQMVQDDVDQQISQHANKETLALDERKQVGPVVPPKRREQVPVETQSEAPAQSTQQPSEQSPEPAEPTVENLPF